MTVYVDRHGIPLEMDSEDTVFQHCIRELGGVLATPTEMKLFATQYQFTARAFGAHKVDKSLLPPSDLPAFRLGCPEYVAGMA